MATNTAEGIRFRPPEAYKPGDVLIPQDLIARRIKEVATEIAGEYKGQGLIVLGILKGSFMVTADLVKILHEKGLTDLEMSFITARSYTGTQGEALEIVQDMDVDPRGRPVLIVDDILDRGVTLKAVHEHVLQKDPTLVKSFVLLDKREARMVDYQADYFCYEIPNVWVQGFGMDTDGKGRADPDIIIGPHDYK